MIVHKINPWWKNLFASYRLSQWATSGWQLAIAVCKKKYHIFTLLKFDKLVNTVRGEKSWFCQRFFPHCMMRYIKAYFLPSAKHKLVCSCCIIHSKLYLKLPLDIFITIAKYNVSSIQFYMSRMLDILVSNRK